MTQVLNGKRVLVLEDEPLIAMFLVDTLEEAGCAVVGPAYNVAQALDLMAKHDIDAAILDVNLGCGATSAPVADALSNLGMPFVFATGYGDQALRKVDREKPRLDKPYFPSAVVAAIAAAIASADPKKPAVPAP